MPLPETTRSWARAAASSLTSSSMACLRVSSSSNSAVPCFQTMVLAIHATTITEPAITATRTRLLRCSLGVFFLSIHDLAWTADPGPDRVGLAPLRPSAKPLESLRTACRRAASPRMRSTAHWPLVNGANRTACASCPPPRPEPECSAGAGVQGGQRCQQAHVRASRRASQPAATHARSPHTSHRVLALRPALPGPPLVRS